MSPKRGGSKNAATVDPKAALHDAWGWRFSLKGSPRHYDDVFAIIDDSPEAEVYFGEALTYERGAGVALWRVKATGFDWLPKLYAWWAEQERTEPVLSTFKLYFPPDAKDAVADLRDYSPTELEKFIKERAPRT